jgi:5-methylcytosine-specific restriction endonuclease McrA
MDHVVALAVGGRHDPANVVPACGPCNSSKGTADWSERLVDERCP